MFGPPQRLWLIGSGQVTAGEIFANGHEFLVFSSGLLSKVPLPPLLVEIQGFQGITARLWRSIILEQNLQRSLAKMGDRYVCSVQNARVAAHAKCLCARKHRQNVPAICLPPQGRYHSKPTRRGMCIND